MKHPMKIGLRRERENGWKKLANYRAVSSSWVGVEECREIIAELRNSTPKVAVGGVASYRDSDGDSRDRGRHLEEIPFERSEDCTDVFQMKQLENLLKSGTFGGKC